MKLHEIREVYHDQTAKTSDIARATNYSLIAVCWVLCNQKLDEVVNYKWVFVFLVASLGLDYIQYLFKGIVSGYIYCKREKHVRNNNNNRVNDNAEIDNFPFWIRDVTTFIFYSKFLATLVAVIFLFVKIFALK